MVRFDTTCWSVVLGAARGDPLKRQDFCHQYEQVIRAYLATRWRMRPDHDDISDAAQEVFLQCFQENGALERVDPARAGGMRAFLYGVTARTAAQIERRGRRWNRDHAADVGDPERIQAAEATLSRAFDKAWAQMVAREARLCLARRAASSGKAARLRFHCLEQRYFHGRWPREIAANLDLDPQRVSELLHEAKSEFRAALLEVMESLLPAATEKELLLRCAELARDL